MTATPSGEPMNREEALAMEGLAGAATWKRCAPPDDAVGPDDPPGGP
jgi:hypothetical protein